jgi:hypothetical protein
MPSSCCSRFMVPAFAVLIALLFFAPAVQAEECSTACQAWSSCDQPCEYCMIFSMDGCAQYESTTCGGPFGGQCGGCGVSSTRTVTQTYRYGPQDGGATYCIGRRYWYGSTNWSQYQRYTDETVTIRYETTTCANGTSTEREVSRTSTYKDCYQFTNGNCQTGDTVLGFDIHGNECY